MWTQKRLRGQVAFLGDRRLYGEGFRSCRSRARSCGARTSFLPGMWNLHGPGIEPVSLALQGRFLTTGPPGKPQRAFNKRAHIVETPGCGSFWFFFLFNLAVPGLSCSMWDIVPRPGIEPRMLRLGVQSLSQWAIREVPGCILAEAPYSSQCISYMLHTHPCIFPGSGWRSSFLLKKRTFFSSYTVKFA